MFNFCGRSRAFELHGKSGWISSFFFINILTISDNAVSFSVAAFMSSGSIRQLRSTPAGKTLVLEAAMTTLPNQWVDLPILTPPDPVNRTSSLVSVASALSQLRRYLIPIRIYRASVLASEWACVSQKRVRWVGWIIRHTGHTIEAISVSVRAYLDPRTWDKEHSTDSHTKNV